MNWWKTRIVRHTKPGEELTAYDALAKLDTSGKWYTARENNRPRVGAISHWMRHCPGVFAMSGWRNICSPRSGMQEYAVYRRL